jgi:hypothetical protein
MSLPLLSFILYLSGLSLLTPNRQFLFSSLYLVSRTISYIPTPSHCLVSLHFSLNTSVPAVTHGRTRETKKYRNTRKQLCMNSARNIFGIAERSSSFAKTLLWCHSSVGWNKAMGRGPLGEWWSLNVDGFGRRRRWKGIVERPKPRSRATPNCLRL